MLSALLLLRAALAIFVADVGSPTAGRLLDEEPASCRGDACAVIVPADVGETTDFSFTEVAITESSQKPFWAAEWRRSRWLGAPGSDLNKKLVWEKRTLGRGSFGRVVKAMPKCDKTWAVAIKIQNSKSNCMATYGKRVAPKKLESCIQRGSTRIREEVATMSLFLGDPRFVQVDAAESGPGPVEESDYSVMMNLADSTLEVVTTNADASIARQQHKLDLSWVVLLIGNLLRGLQTMHERSIVHRDIKPANVMVVCELRRGREFCYPMIGDFGGSCSLQEEPPQGVPLCYIEPSGTPLFFSPEYNSNHNPSYASDVWAAGITAFQVVTGKLPYRLEFADTKEELNAVLKSWTSSDLAGLGLTSLGRLRQIFGPSVPEADLNTLRAVLRGMLRKDPKSRLTATQALNWLKPLLEAAEREAGPQPAVDLLPACWYGMKGKRPHRESSRALEEVEAAESMPFVKLPTLATAPDDQKNLAAALAFAVQYLATETVPTAEIKVRCNVLLGDMSSSDWAHEQWNLHHAEIGGVTYSRAQLQVPAVAKAVASGMRVTLEAGRGERTPLALFFSAA